MCALSAAQADRAAGTLLAQACGDALGVPYEFEKRRLDAGVCAQMRGGGLGPYAPGEYSDDTQMAVCIAEVAATGADLRSPDALDAVAEGFLRWRAHGATDIGAQTRQVLGAAAPGSGRTASRLHDAAAALHRRTGHTAGNGALMRTAPVALAHLGDDDALAEAARSVAELTHADPLAGDSCVLWCIAIDRAVREDRFDGLVDGLALLPAARRGQWQKWIAEAEARQPWQFGSNGFTVTAMQAAWSAIHQTAVPPDDPGAGSFPCLHLQHALDAAVHAGHDTDTVAAIAGGVLGARWGASAVPFAWQRIVHGWPGLRGRDLARLGLLAARKGRADSFGWPAGSAVEYGEQEFEVVLHPDDPGVLLGTAHPGGVDDVDAVVSLLRLGRDEVPRAGVAPSDHIEIRLIDSEDPADNPNLAFVIDDAARAVAALRDEGRTVLLHCVAAHARTPTVAARYAALRGRDPSRVISALQSRTGHRPGRALTAALAALAAADRGKDPAETTARAAAPNESAAVEPTDDSAEESGDPAARLDQRKNVPMEPAPDSRPETPRAVDGAAPHTGPVAPNAQVRTELAALLEADPSRLGEVYRGRQRGLDAESIAEELGVSTSSFVWNYERIMAAVLDGELPSAPTVALAVARRLRSILKSPTLSAAARTCLESNLAELDRRANDVSARVVEVERAQADTQAAEAQNMTGIYVYALPHYLRYPFDSNSGRTLMKVGRSDSDVIIRFRNQTRTTALPEEPILLRIYPTADETVLAEGRFHRLLEAADHYRSTVRTAGREWFVTSTRFLDEVADVMGLPIQVINDGADIPDDE